MQWPKPVEDKLKVLPNDPGVYFMKDANRKIIYIGKAAVLKNRVGSYFQKSTVHGPKNQVMMTEIADLDWIALGSEVEALFMESELIKRYKPKFNIDLKDEKQFNYIKITTQNEFPVVSYVRRPLDDKATYFGPFTSSDGMKRAMKMLRRIFPYVTHETMPPRACLQAHLGLCPNPEEGAITSAQYRRHIRQLIRYLQGDQDKLLREAEREMNQAAKRKDYEAAAQARDRLKDMQALQKQMIFGDKESFDLALDQALAGLADRLQLKGAPRRIEAYDISHMQGTDNVASMIVFQYGVPNRDEYRRFKMRLPGNDDFGHMREVMRRRFSTKNMEEWPKPDLLLIDGGKGQLAAALGVLDELGITIPAIGLAKREEEIIRRNPSAERISASELPGGARRTSSTPPLPASDPPGTSSHPTNYLSKGHWDDEAWIYANVDFEVMLLPKDSHVIQLLQRVRDEAHRFAVTYHALLRGKRQTASILDNIPGVGPATRKKIIKAFGSVRGLSQATEAEVVAVLGTATGQRVLEHLAKSKAKH